MEAFDISESLIVLLGLVILSFIVNLVIKIAYRLYFSPLAKFLGPKLAAISRIYEFYYDVVRRGQYTFKIAKLHEIYGPIVRIGPGELHVNDPEFYEQLYSQHSPRNKDGWFVDTFQMPTSAFSTLDHRHHRLRRSAISPYFSRARVQTYEPIILAKLRRMYERLRQLSSPNVPFHIETAYHCLTTDIATEATATCWNYLEETNLFPDWTDSLKALLEIACTERHIPWIMKALACIPRVILRRVYKTLYLALEYRDHCKEMVMALVQDSIMEAQKPTEKQSPKLFRNFLSCNLPEEKRTIQRLISEFTAIIGAATVTTADTLTVITFHVLNNPEILHNLRKELSENVTEGVALQWNNLERLPYLTGVVYEGLRLSYGLSHRLQRIPTTEDLTLNEWVIPRNTSISMTSVLVHHNESIFPDSHKFIPERWINPEDRKRLNKYMVSFSKGSRQCVGMHLAYANLFLAVPTIFQQFDMKLYDTTVEDVELARDFLLPNTKSGSKGVRVLIEERGQKE